MLGTRFAPGLPLREPRADPRPRQPPIQRPQQSVNRLSIGSSRRHTILSLIAGLIAVVLVIAVSTLWGHVSAVFLSVGSDVNA